MQFSSYSVFQNYLNSANYSVGSTLGMPHTRRTWSILWGSPSAVNLGQPVPNMPTILGNAAGTLHR